MLADSRNTNLQESIAVWEAKESSAALLLGRGEAEVCFFRWPREKRFTVLEDFILQVIERGLGNSDAEIADVLCLDEGDVSVILGDGKLKDEVQGDESRRTLSEGFSRRMPDGVAIVTGKNPPRDIGLADPDRESIIALIENCGHPAKRNNLPKSQKEWMKETGARIFALSVSAFRYDDKSRVFSCGGKVIPSALNGELGKRFGKIGSKSAPSDAVCHRDEF